MSGLAPPDSGCFLKKKAHSSESVANQGRGKFCVYRTATPRSKVLPNFLSYIFNYLCITKSEETNNNL